MRNLEHNSLDAIKAQLREWIQLDYIIPEDIPSIELYMDQVTTFMDQQLANNKRNEEDKTLTKTMINNYTKNNMLPPPEKKKYSKDHIILLIYIYYLKNFISIRDIQTLLTPMIETYFSKEENGIDLNDIYSDIFHLEKDYYNHMKSSVFDSYEMVSKAFEGKSDYLKELGFIMLLSYDIYAKKQLIEKMIDGMKPVNPEPAKSKENTKNNK